MAIQIYLNGHEWLARKLDANGVGYTKIDNVFTHIEDVGRAQAFSDRFTSLDWPRILEAYACKVNPILGDLLEGHTHYWVVRQREYAREIMSFLGRKLHWKFQGELITDLLDLWHLRIPGMRIKHRV